MKMKRFNEWDTLTKQIFWTTIAFAIFGIVNVIVFAVVSSLGLVETSNLSYVFCVAYIGGICIPVVLKIFAKTKFDLWFIITFDIYIILAVLAGSLWRLYHITDGYDKFVHVLFGLMAAFLGYYIFYKSGKNKGTLVFMFLFVFSFSMMCGAVWEMFEFTCDGVIGTDAQVTAGLFGREAVENTMYDIICDFGGALIATITATILEFKARKKQLNEPTAEN